MPTLSRLVLPALLACVVAASASAQACHGFTSFRDAPVRVSAGVVHGDGLRLIGGDAALGTARGPYASVGGSRTTYTDIAGTTRTMSAVVGWAIPIPGTRRLEFCPEVGVNEGWLPMQAYDVGTGIVKLDGRARDWTFGGALGGVARVAESLELAPTAAVTFFSSKAWWRYNGQEVNSTATEFGVIQLGVGLIARRVFSLQPFVQIPVGLENAKSDLGITLSAHLGHPEH